MSKKYIDRYLQDKIEMLQRCNNSRDIFDELESATEQYRYESSKSDFRVFGMPFGSHYEIDTCISLLHDLYQYTDLVKTDSEIPDELSYITPYWNKVSDDDSDE